MNKGSFFNIFNTLLLESDFNFKTSANKNIFIKANRSLEFPVNEVTRYDLPDKLLIESSLLGLYGVESPLPMYLNELALSDSLKGQRLRALLDLINHRFFVLYFLSWKLFRLDYNPTFEKYKFKPKKKNKTYMREQIQGICRPYIVTINDKAYDWVEIPESVGLGKIKFKTILGRRILYQNKVLINILGVKSSEVRDFLPNGKKYEKISSLIKVVNFKLILDILHLKRNTLNRLELRLRYKL